MHGPVSGAQIVTFYRIGVKLRSIDVQYECDCLVRTLWFVCENAKFSEHARLVW